MKARTDVRVLTWCMWALLFAALLPIIRPPIFLDRSAPAIEESIDQIYPGYPTPLEPFKEQVVMAMLVRR